MKLLIMQFLLAFSYILHVGPKYLPHHPIFERHKPTFLPEWNDK